MRHTDAREKQAQIIIHFRDGSYRTARIATRGLLVDGNGGAQPIDLIDVWFLHKAQELPGIGTQRFDIAALPFGIDSIERQARFAGAAQTSNND